MNEILQSLLDDIVAGNCLPFVGAGFSSRAACLAVDCINAAATMCCLCVDMATRSLLLKEDERELNAKIRRNLGLRLPWLIDNGMLPEALRGLSTCVKEDGNDGAQVGTLSEVDSQDLLDFTVALLERSYTEPERLRLAKERRDTRRALSPTFVRRINDGTSDE